MKKIQLIVDVTLLNTNENITQEDVSLELNIEGDYEYTVTIMK